jgi:hypothetical protein
MRVEQNNIAVVSFEGPADFNFFHNFFHVRSHLSLLLRAIFRWI